MLAHGTLSQRTPSCPGWPRALGLLPSPPWALPSQAPVAQAAPRPHPRFPMSLPITSPTPCVLGGLFPSPFSPLAMLFEPIPPLGSAFPSEDYKRHFSPRDLRVFSAHPLLVYPTHYAGESNWLSDTETSTIWDDDAKKTEWAGSHKTLRDPRGGTSYLRSTARDEL